MRCLWLARTIPFPLTAGDRVYSARLAEALAGTGAEVAFLGLDGAEPAIPMPGIAWEVVAGGPRGQWRALVSTLPLVGKRHETPAYHAAIRQRAAASRWDAVVIDQYGMGWALRHRAIFQGNPVFAFITMDHEESVTRLQYQDRSASFGKRLYFLQNHLKTKMAERRATRLCDLVTTITEADAAAFRACVPGSRTLVLTPGYFGPRVAVREITAEVPRRILMFGSFRWSAKQTSLRLFLDHADEAVARAGAEIRVVGDAPPAFIAAIEARYRSVRMTGFIKDPTPHFDARLAVLAEPIGGGFKIKLLDYIFRRMPVAALEVCAEGLPPAVHGAMILRPELQSLVAAMIEALDQPSRLQAMQIAAFKGAAEAFSWADRGRLLRQTLTTLVPQDTVS